jgi:predicted dehydrogenase
MTLADRPIPNQISAGIIGCGFISAVYCRALQAFPHIRLKSCADLNSVAAERRAAEFGLSAVSVEALLADDEIDIVLNLTNPSAHYELNQRILKARKHVYSEKPLGLSMPQAQQLLELAQSVGRRVGSAPDTFMGGAHQTALKLLQGGVIGKVTSATAFTMFAGVERFHATPEVFYQRGAGPVLDMGPYHITHLVSFLGPVAEVRAVAATTWPVRHIRVGPSAGRQFKSEVPTHYVGILGFENGAVGTLIASFDGWAHTHPHLELYGTDGTLTAPNPDYFGGELRVARPGEDFRVQPLQFGFADGNLRGLGVADMVCAIAESRPHRASGELALHVLEVMLAFDRSAQTDRAIQVSSRCPAPEPLSTSDTFYYVPVQRATGA